MIAQHHLLNDVSDLINKGVLQHPLVERSATSLRRWCCAIMSGVWNEERVNIGSQCTEIALPLNALIVEFRGSSISPNLPCGAMISAIAL